MPGRKSTHAATVPWNVAIQMVGSEAALTAGVKVKTWKGWRPEDSGVPAYRIVTVLRDRLARQSRVELDTFYRELIGHLEVELLPSLSTASEELRAYIVGHLKAQASLLAQVARTGGQPPEIPLVPPNVPVPRQPAPARVAHSRGPRGGANRPAAG